MALHLMPSLNSNHRGETFNPNVDGDGQVDKTRGGFPVIDQVGSVEEYAQVVMKVVEPYGSPLNFLTSISKGLEQAPEMQVFGKISMMPDGYNKGIMQWPGIPPLALTKMVRENLAPQLIINQRVDDVLKYSELSAHPWKPGWRIVMRNGLGHPDKQDMQDIREAEVFVMNCNAETGLDARARDAKNYMPFSDYLAAVTRDTLTYDGIAVWTDMSVNGMVKSFRPYSAGNIRLCPKGLVTDRTVFAVGVDDAGNVAQTFTRDQLIWRVRNRRLEADIYDYGYPELEMGFRLVQALTFAVDLNIDTFNKNSTPNGILKVKGQWTQRQLDVLSRIWGNLKRGNTKSWALPVIPIPKDGDLEVLDLGMIKGNEVYYQDWMNMVQGMFCALYRFPPKRMGYRISGKGPDAKNEPPANSVQIDEADTGLLPLLLHHERTLNQYIIWTRWPHLMLQFTGKSPEEDAREYQARTQAMTIKERRAMVDLPSLETAAGKDHKEIGALMDLCPSDSALAGVYQSLVSAYMGNQQAEAEQTAQPGARMQGQKDPAKVSDHGHTGGVRRNSASEKD